MPILTRKPERRLRPEDRAFVGEIVSLATAGEDPRPNPDLDRLSESQALEVVERGERMQAGELDRDDPRFWRLVAEASGFPADHFERRAEQAKAARLLRESEARERRLPLGRRATTNLLLAMYEALADEDIWLDDVIVIVATLVQLAAGKPLISTSRIEGSGVDAAVVVNANMGFVGVADGSSLTLGWQSRTKFLAEQGWLAISGRGPERRITLGPRLRALVDLAGAAS